MQYIKIFRRMNPFEKKAVSKQPARQGVAVYIAFFHRWNCTVNIIVHLEYNVYVIHMYAYYRYAKENKGKLRNIGEEVSIYVYLQEDTSIVSSGETIFNFLLFILSFFLFLSFSKGLSENIASAVLICLRFVRFFKH